MLSRSGGGPAAPRVVFKKGFEERHYHDKPPSAPAEEGDIGMMRLLGVGPIDIIYLRVAGDPEQ